jgi:hypothetical protein
MIRNEDFFILRWGQPEFIREHIRSNTPSYVNGYFVGSEGYIPALDYSSLDFPGKNWQYGFEKQWLFYLLWGRFMYNPGTPDTVFEQAFDLRFGSGTGKHLLKAFSLASKMPLKLASFYRATWDYTLYAEGFLAPRPAGSDSCFDPSSSFISVEELICHETLDPALLSIGEFCRLEAENTPVPVSRISPLELADQLEQDGNNAIRIMEDLKGTRVFNDPNGLSEAQDVLTWSYLSLYFGEKLRGAVALQRFRLTGNNKTQAISHLQKALEYWKKVSECTKNRYKTAPLVSLPGSQGEDMFFSWEKFLPEVERDIKIAESAIREF